jgi:hypothetical protein
MAVANDIERGTLSIDGAATGMSDWAADAQADAVVAVAFAIRAAGPTSRLISARVVRRCQWLTIVRS